MAGKNFSGSPSTWLVRVNRISHGIFRSAGNIGRKMVRRLSMTLAACAGTAIVEPNGALVYFQKMDGSQYAAIGVAIDKATATASAIYRRPTTAFDAGLRGGNTYLLTLRGMNALPGSVPIVFESKPISSAPRAARASRMFK